MTMQRVVVFVSIAALVLIVGMWYDAGRGPRYELVRCYVPGQEPIFEGVLRRDGKTLDGARTVELPACAVCTRQAWEPRGGGRY